MSLRPTPARWFEVLTTREDLTLTLEALADTGSIELEMHSETHPQVSVQDLTQRMRDFDRLARRYRPYWPAGELSPASIAGRPSLVLERALTRVVDWERAARPLIQDIERLGSEGKALQVLDALLAELPEASLDFTLLSQRGGVLAARLFLLPPEFATDSLPGDLLISEYRSERQRFLLAVGTVTELQRLAGELSAAGAETAALPGDVGGTPPRARAQVEKRLLHIGQRLARLRREVDALAPAHHLPEALGDIARMDWFLHNVSTLPVSKNFAWVTGWTSDVEGRGLSAALALARADAVIHFPPPPETLEAPLVMRNPGWARPFELFTRLLGTPARDEVDPSRLLAVLVPLLFGYMFGDVGQGLVLLVAGLTLRSRWPALGILIGNGASAMLFGFAFGSVFGREDILPALWLHPISEPLPVLMAPLAGGVLVILTGLALNAAEALWRGAFARWLGEDAAIVVLYLSLIASLFVPQAVFSAAAAILWYFSAAAMRAGPARAARLAAAAGGLLEQTLQLLINTLSFVRVGAFALAHGGLSLAFNIMAAGTDNPLLWLLILVLGNALVLALEGLVVTIQTTRLVLFEFFIRFLRGAGRTFQPLRAPATDTAMRRVT